MSLVGEWCSPCIDFENHFQKNQAPSLDLGNSDPRREGRGRAKIQV